MTVSTVTLGCKVNQYESQAVCEIFAKSGYEVLPPSSPADIIVVNSCTVTAESSRKTRQTVRKMRKLNPDAVIVLTGCMVQAFPESAEELTEADIIVGNTETDRIPELCEDFFAAHNRKISVKPHLVDEKYLDLSVSAFAEHTRSYMKIEDGCNRFCSYCIIPYARGRVRSRSLESIKREAIKLAESGYKEIVLVGINLSAFGQDTGVQLCDAVMAVAQCEGVKRVRLGSLECDMMSDESLKKLSECEKFCPQFHLSLQSGCDKTLSSMNRKYDTQFYAQLVAKIRSIFDNPSITTDIMVGFAGESDEDFDNSLQFVKSIGFARSHVFVYSEREGTVAAKRGGKVSSVIRQQRAVRMAEVCQNSEKEFLQSQIGRTANVLFETREGKFWTGYTENYTRVFVNSEDISEGNILKVKIVSAEKDYCKAELL